MEKDMRELLMELEKNEIDISVQDRNLKLKFNSKTLPNDLVAKIKVNKEELINYLTRDPNSIPLVPDSEEGYVLSSAQYRIWVQSHFEQARTIYNEPGYFELAGNYDFELFEKAIASVIDRHEVLRTIFKEDSSGNIKQWVIPSLEFDLSIAHEDYTDRSNARQAVIDFIEQDSKVAFDLDKAPLFRITLFHLVGQEHIFYINLHHIISDGWSIEVLKKDVFAFYQYHNQRSSLELQPLSIQYKDYAAWQVNQLQHPLFEKHEKYWLKRLSGNLPVLDLPSSKIRPKVKTFRGRHLSTSISSQEADRLREFNKQNGGTMFVGLMASWTALLYRYTQEQDIIIGSPIAGRDHKQLEDQIGLYLNTIAVRNEVKPEDDFLTLYDRVKTSVLSAYDHWAYPFDHLVEQLNLPRDTSRNPIFDFMMVLQNQQEHQSQFFGSSSRVHDDQVHDLGPANPKFDIDLSISDDEQCIRLNLLFNEDVYDKSIILGLLRHYKQLLTQLITNPGKRITDHVYLTDDEKHRLLVEFNDTDTDFPEEKTIVDLFRDKAVSFPEKVAIKCESREITYRQLEETSNKLASYLIANHGVERGGRVGLLIEKNEWQIISILAILKTGAAYVPMDAEAPDERLTYIKSDSQCKVIVDNLELQRFQDNEKQYAVDPPAVISSPDDLVYIIYTSGTTGKPKGVKIKTRSLVNYVCWSIRQYNITEKDVVGKHLSLAYDACVEEIYPTILSGATLQYISKETIVDAAELKAFTENKGITVLPLPPVLCEAFFKLSNDSLRMMITGGERLSFFKKQPFPVYNHYGPTETTVTCLTYEIQEGQTNIPIGRPVANTRVYILDPFGHPCPIGVPGELFIGGVGLAEGYFESEELTKSRFVTFPSIAEKRLYKTGDNCKWNAAGNIEFLGREDNQVKVRGYRIELDEIGLALQLKSTIKNAVAVVEGEGSNKIIVAYFSSEVEERLVSIKKHLSRSLPAYMIPSLFIQLTSFPLTSNEKIDMDALNQSIGTPVKDKYMAPKLEIEVKLVQILAADIEKEEESIGIHDNFFDLGLNSISMVKMLKTINSELMSNISVVDLFECPNIRDLAMHIEARKTGQYQDSEAEEAPDLNEIIDLF